VHPPAAHAWKLSKSRRPRPTSCPLATPGRARLDADRDRAEARARLERAVPLRRTGEVDEVAYGVLFLASDEASYVTGAELAIDGGFVAR